MPTVVVDPTTTEAGVGPDRPADATGARSALRGRLRRWRSRHGRDALLIALVSAFVFPLAPQSPTTGLDPSWEAGLALGAQSHLVHGRDLVFTYGPLGFASSTVLLLPRPWLAATATWLAATVALVTLAYRRLATGLPPWLAAGATAVVAVVILRYAFLFTVLEAIAVLVALGLVARAAVVRRGPAAVMGAFAGGALLVKIDAGIFSTIVLGSALIAGGLAGGEARIDRRLVAATATFGASVLGTLVALWSVCGQPLAALPAWLARATSVVTGYSEAMGLDEPARPGDAVALAAFAGWLALGVLRPPAGAVRQRLALGAVLAVILFLAFKHGFVRMNPLSFLSLIALTGVGLVPLWGARRAMALCTAALVAMAIVGALDLPAVLYPGRPVDRVVATATLAASRDEQTRLTGAQRLALRRTLGFSPALVAPLTGHSVHISPWEAMVAYAYPDLRWRPLPVFQDYVAYTTGLDEMNAAALASERRPDHVLRMAGVAVDGRLPGWEPPAASLALVCRYRETAGEGQWLVLTAGTDRCGAPTIVRRGDARFGAPVTMPSGDGIVVARFSGVNAGVADRARTALFKAREVYVDVGRGARHRFVTGTQTSWHVVRAPACARRMLDGGAPDIDAVTFSRSSRGAEGDDPFSYEVATIPFAC